MNKNVAYNKENYLRRAKEVQKLTEKLRERGLFYKEIYRDYVEHQYKISMRTYKNWLKAK